MKIYLIIFIVLTLLLSGCVYAENVIEVPCNKIPEKYSSNAIGKLKTVGGDYLDIEGNVLNIDQLSNAAEIKCTGNYGISRNNQQLSDGDIRKVVPMQNSRRCEHLNIREFDIDAPAVRYFDTKVTCYLDIVKFRESLNSGRSADCKKNDNTPFFCNVVVTRIFSSANSYASGNLLVDWSGAGCPSGQVCYNPNSKSNEGKAKIRKQVSCINSDDQQLKDLDIKTCPCYNCYIDKTRYCDNVALDTSSHR